MIKKYSLNDLNAESITRKTKPIEKRSLSQDKYLEYNEKKLNKCEIEIVEFLAEMQNKREKSKEKNKSIHFNEDSDSDQTVTGDYVN
jgi:hypothetical protein